MTNVERGELDQDKEEDERCWVVCEPAWQVIAHGAMRRELMLGVNEVAVWRAEQEAARRAEESAS